MSHKREDFEIRSLYSTSAPRQNCTIRCSVGRRSPCPVYLHSDGRIFARCPEFWPTEEDAEKILDKYYPESKHIWKHGDVFRRESGVCHIYLMLDSSPIACCVRSKYEHPSVLAPNVNVCLADATFLFNIKDKL